MVDHMYTFSLLTFVLIKILNSVCSMKYVIIVLDTIYCRLENVMYCNGEWEIQIIWRKASV